MISKYYITDWIKPPTSPLISTAGSTPGTQFQAQDVLFNWYAFEVPKGTCRIHNITTMIYGTDFASGSNHDIDIDLYFAKHGGPFDDPFVLTTIPNIATSSSLSGLSKNDIIATQKIDASVGVDVGGLKFGHMWNSGQTLSSFGGVIIEGDPNYNDSTSGRHTPGTMKVWIAGITLGNFDFGTGLLLNQVGNQAADMTGDNVTLTVDGTNTVSMFEAGEILVGSTGTTQMEFVTQLNATSMVVKNITAQIDNDEEIIPTSSVRFRFGLEYY